MNLLLYWLCNSYSVSAFAKATIGILIFFIVINIVCCFILGPACVIDVVIDAILLIVFWLLGFPINAILITFLVTYFISSVLFFFAESPLNGSINAVITILNIVGLCFFHANLI